MHIRDIVNEVTIEPEVAAQTCPENAFSLHAIAENCGSLEELQLGINRLGINAYTSCLVTDDRGHLPIDLLFKNNNLPDAVFDSAEAILYQVMMVYKPLPIQMPIDVNCVLSSYKYLNNDDLNYYLRVGCELVNETRTLINESYTHPDCLKLNLAAINSLAARLENLRDNLDHQPSLTTVEGLRKQAEIIIKYGCANCDEYCTALLYVLSTKISDRSICGDKLKVLKGDHVFPTIGNNFLENTNYKLWPKEQVICDALTGTVFPAFCLETHLRDHKTYSYQRKPLNVFTSFNPSFHKLVHTGCVASSIEKNTQLFFNQSSTREGQSAKPSKGEQGFEHKGGQGFEYKVGLS